MRSTYQVELYRLQSTHMWRDLIWDRIEQEKGDWERDGCRRGIEGSRACSRDKISTIPLTGIAKKNWFLDTHNTYVSGFMMLSPFSEICNNGLQLRFMKVITPYVYRMFCNQKYSILNGTSLIFIESECTCVYMNICTGIIVIYVSTIDEESIYKSMVYSRLSSGES